MTGLTLGADFMIAVAGIFLGLLALPHAYYLAAWGYVRVKRRREEEHI